MSKSLIIMLSLILIVSCQNESDLSNSNLGKFYAGDDAIAVSEEIDMEPPMNSTPPSPPIEFKLEKGSKIIKNGFMKFEVDNLESAKSKVDTLLKNINGYYENEQYNSYGNRTSYSLQLRIPNSKFDSTISVIENAIGDMKSKNIKAKDVTEEYVDLNIRLENNLAYLNQYKEILRKAKSVKEILEVQEKIRRIEEEINSKKGRIKYLDDKVKYSSLNLEITELITREISNKPNFGRRLINAFNNGVQVFLSFIVGLVNLWPFLLLIIFIFIGRKSLMDKLRSWKNGSKK